MVRRCSPQVLDLGLGQKSKTLTKDFDASDEFLRSHDFELGTKSDLFREVSSVRGEKPVRSGFEGRDKYGNIGLMTDQMAMPIDFLLVGSGITLDQAVSTTCCKRLWFRYLTEDLERGVPGDYLPLLPGRTQRG